MNEYDVSVTEVLDILNYLPKDMVSKISTKFIQFLKEHEILEYKPNFDYSQGLDKIQLSNKTKVLLAMVYRNYICSDEERVEYDKVLYQNEELYQSNLREKYNPDNIFSNNKNTYKSVKSNENISKELVEYKQYKWYTKIFQKILSFLKL